MRPTKIALVGVCFVVVALGIFTVVNAGLTNTQQFTPQPESTPFFAILTFETYEGDGCGCVQIDNVYINASGLTTDHNVGNTTNNDGICTLELEFDQTYRISIEHSGYTKILMDVTVIGDQSLSFHLQEVEEDSFHSHELVVEGKTIDEYYQYIR